MNPDDGIKKILEAAIQAPSAENSQPWEIMVKDNRIFLYNLPHIDVFILNFRLQGAYVSHGALIENILIAAKALGYEVSLEIFPDKRNPNLIAVFELAESRPEEEPLYSCIFDRVTNRKPYWKKSLSDEQKACLTGVPRELGFGKVLLIEEREDRESLAEAMAAYDQLILENRHMRRYIFEYMRWTGEEVLRRQDGIDVRTLEFSRFHLFLFRLMQYWPFYFIANSTRIAGRIAHRRAAKLYRSTPAIGAIFIPGDENEHYILGGRVFERVWLEATRLGLAFHPIAGITFFFLKTSVQKSNWIPRSHAKVISKLQEQVRSIFKMQEGHILTFFRVGYSDPPRVRSARYPLEKVVKILP